jgi:hypothetical protein
MSFGHFYCPKTTQTVRARDQYQRDRTYSQKHMYIRKYSFHNQIPISTSSTVAIKGRAEAPYSLFSIALHHVYTQGLHDHGVWPTKVHIHRQAQNLSTPFNGQNSINTRSRIGSLQFTLPSLLARHRLRLPRLLPHRTGPHDHRNCSTSHHQYFRLHQRHWMVWQCVHADVRHLQSAVRVHLSLLPGQVGVHGERRAVRSWISVVWRGTHVCNVCCRKSNCWDWSGW